MANLRSVNTKFWDDPWIETLTVSEKLLFLYLITNSYANLCGIYEITIKRICFETGIDNKTVLNALERFGRVRKAYFVNENYIFMPNWLKNQNLNTNMKKGVLTLIQELPKEVKINILGNDYQTIQKDYQMVLNTLLKYEVEVLEEEVLEEEIEQVKITIPSFDEFSDYVLDNEPNINLGELELKYKSWVENGWKDGNDKKIKNWKTKILNTIPYFKHTGNGKQGQQKRNSHTTSEGLRTIINKSGLPNR